MTNELFILSGLGADERAFEKLDFSGYTPNHIKWITPINSEPIAHYAARLIDQIPAKKPILIGLSFGGIMAIEIAKQIEPERLILISSAKVKQEIPFYFRLAGKLKLHKMIPIRLLKSSNLISNWLFGIKSPYDKNLFKQILMDSDPNFLKWAIDKVATWKNQVLPKNVFHIHGTNDKILPLAFINANLRVEDGGHLMILNKSEELNKILRSYLKENN